MAASSQAVAKALLTFAFLSCFFLISESRYSSLCLLSPLVRHSLFSPCLTPRCDGTNNFSHLREQEKIHRWRLSTLQKLTRGHRTLLLRCGDVEQNPGPPASGVKKPKTTQLTVMHVNARSLLSHHDDVAALLLANRPHLLAIS